MLLCFLRLFTKPVCRFFRIPGTAGYAIECLGPVGLVLFRIIKGEFRVTMGKVIFEYLRRSIGFKIDGAKLRAPHESIADRFFPTVLCWKEAVP